MTTLSIDGTRLDFRREGSGPAIVLVHGLGGPAMWERVAGILAAEHDVLIPHLPGFGESPPGARPLSSGAQAALITRMLGELNIRDAVLAGVSYGAGVAAAAAAASPERVRGLVLVCPTGSKPYPWPARSPTIGRILHPALRAALSNGRITEALSRKSFHDISARPPGLVDRYLEDLRRPGRLECLVSAVEELRTRGGGLPALLERVRAPLTLVWGANDRTIPPSTARILQKHRPDAVLHILPGCAHSVALEKPREVARILAGAATPVRAPG